MTRVAILGVMAEADDEQPVAREDIVLFVESTSTGGRTLVGLGGGNFTAPAEITITAEALLQQMVDLNDIAEGARVGIVQVIGQGLQKQITVHAAIDESVTRDAYEYDPEEVAETLDTLRS